MIRIKHDSWRKQEYEHAMDVYVNEHTMDAYIDHGWVDRSGGFYQLINIWISLLGACRKWGNVKLGRLSFDQLIQLDNNGVAAYVLMADIFGSVGMLEDEKKSKTWSK